MFVTDNTREDPTQTNGFNLTDMGNAERLASLYGEDLRHVYRMRRWVVYDGTRWVPDDRGVIVKMAKSTARSIYGEAQGAEDPEEREALAKHAVRSEAKNRIGAMIDLATTEPGMSVTPEEMDVSPWLLNVQNGTIDLRTGKMRPHDRDDLGDVSVAREVHDAVAPESAASTATRGRRRGEDVEAADHLHRALPDRTLAGRRARTGQGVDAGACRPPGVRPGGDSRDPSPKGGMTGEWPGLSPAYFGHLEETGVGAVADELTAISKRHGGRRLVLLDHEETVWGDRSLRVIFQQWWEEQTGEPVLELVDDGRDLRFDGLPKRTKPIKPKDRKQDRRWRDDAALGLSWPLGDEHLRRWIAMRHWQQARSRTNPHSYTVRSWGDDRAFWLVVMHFREHGEQEEWGGDTYTYFVIDGMKYWTMGADLMSTVILNRKPWGQDPGDREKGAEAPAAAPLTRPLFNGDRKGTA